MPFFLPKYIIFVYLSPSPIPPYFDPHNGLTDLKSRGISGRGDVGKLPLIIKKIAQNKIQNTFLKTPQAEVIV